MATQGELAEGSSLNNSILNRVRREKISYAEALSVIVDSRTPGLPRKRQIRPNTPRGKLLQRLFTLGPLRLVPDPHEDGWIYKGSYRYAAKLDGYAIGAEKILIRLVRLQGHEKNES